MGNNGLKGETGSGEKGQKGDAGLDGSNGLKGETGIGIKGDQGSKGDVGIKGDSGSGSVVGIAWTPVITNSSVSANATLNSVSGYYITNGDIRSEEHTSEFKSQMRNSYAVFCL